MKEKIIIDGDGGGDEMQLASVFLANHDRCEVIGTTSVFGNVDHETVFRNMRNIVSFLHAPEIPCYPGATGPTGESPLEGDGAHGRNGLGGAILPDSPAPIETKQAVDFILEQLRAKPPGTITITASGPLTNIAQAFRRDPETMRRAKQIVIMGGCTTDLQAKDMPLRRGNITEHAEFNFQQAACDARTVMESDLPITLLPMNCTQQLSFTPERRNRVAEAFAPRPDLHEPLLTMLSAAQALDQAKFGADAFMHDVHCALYTLYPELYQTQHGAVHVATDREKRGRTEFVEGPSNIRVAIAAKDPDALFEHFFQSITHCLEPSVNPTQIIEANKAFPPKSNGLSTP